MKYYPKNFRSTRFRFTKTMNMIARFTILVKLLKGASLNLISSLLMELKEISHHCHYLHSPFLCTVLFLSFFSPTHPTDHTEHKGCRPSLPRRGYYDWPFGKARMPASPSPTPSSQPALSSVF